MAMETEILPVAADTCTVNGWCFRADSPAWLGLNLAGAEVRTQATIMVWICGSDAPYDLHLRTPFCHPDDRAMGMTDEDCWYRVRPRMKAGGQWKKRKVSTVAIVRHADDSWKIHVGYKRPKEAA